MLQDKQPKQYVEFFQTTACEFCILFLDMLEF